MDDVEKKQGMIALPPDTVMRRELGQTRGTVLSIAESAWSDEYGLREPSWWQFWRKPERVPKPRCAVGDRVLFRQYAGEMLDVEGPAKYRIINDKDVYAVLEPISDQQTA